MVIYKRRKKMLFPHGSVASPTYTTLLLVFVFLDCVSYNTDILLIEVIICAGVIGEVSNVFI